MLSWINYHYTISNRDHKLWEKQQRLWQGQIKSVTAVTAHDDEQADKEQKHYP